MEITSAVEQSSQFDHQQVAKNKRKKFNPKYMLTNSCSDNDESDHDVLRDEDQHEIEERNQSSNDEQQMNRNEVIKPTSNACLQQRDQRSNSSTPPNASNPFISPSKLSLLQSFNLQQQQQMFQQAAINAIAPQLSQQIGSATNLNETKAKFREFAFKTMQDLLNIYGLPLPPNEIIDAMSESRCFFIYLE